MYLTSLEGGEPPSVAELMGGPPVVMRVETTLPLPELAPAADEGEALRIDDVIANVRDDAAWADKILPTLPIEWKEYLTSTSSSTARWTSSTRSTPTATRSSRPTSSCPSSPSCRKGNLGTSTKRTARIC